MGKADPIKITGRIVRYEVKKTDAMPAPAAVAPPPAMPDVDPRFATVLRRDEATWDSKTIKFVMTGSTGNVPCYIVVGFGDVCGSINSKKVCIARPLEFFLPAGQSAVEHQWVTASMRFLSLAARGGFLAKALADMRKVTWDRGPVWYGTARSGKRMTHESQVSCIAWVIQNALYEHGYFDEDYQDRPVEELSVRYEAKQAVAAALSGRRAVELDVSVPVVIEPTPAASTSQPAEVAKQVTQDSLSPKARVGKPNESGFMVVDICSDSNCQGDIVLMDGCATCQSCLSSSCS